MCKYYIIRDPFQISFNKIYIFLNLENKKLEKKLNYFFKSKSYFIRIDISKWNHDESYL